ncbi:hypothetical protein JCM10213_003136 [Rhodosporidiobolus nylandii]
MAQNPTLYASSFSQSRSPSSTFTAASQRLSLSRALTSDLASYYAARCEVEEQYVRSLQKLSSRLHGQGKDAVFRELGALGIAGPEADRLIGKAFADVRRRVEGEVAETARVHEVWRKKVGEEVERPLRESVGRGEWARWNATERELGGLAREFEQAGEKVQKAQQKSTRSSKPSSKLLTAQSSVSQLGSQLSSALPSFLTLTQSLDLHHSAFLKEALVRAGTATSDLGRERMEAGERLLVQVLAVDESAEAEEWALREGMRLGGGGGGGAAFGIGRTNGSALPSVGEFGEETDSINGNGAPTRAPRDRQETASSARQTDFDAASTRSGSVAAVPPPSAGAGVERSRTMSRPPPACPLPLPSADDARSIKESKTGLGGKLSSLLGGSSKNRDRSSSIPNSAKYASFSTAPEAPPVPTPTPGASSAAPAAPTAPTMERRDTGASGGSDLLGGSSAGLAAPLQPDQSGGGKRKSLMPGGSLFRRPSKGNALNDFDAPAVSAPASGAGPASPQFAQEMSAEPSSASVSAPYSAVAENGNGAGAGRVDAEGFSVPPEGYDRPIDAGAGGQQGRGLMDDDEDEPLGNGNGESSLPKLSIAPLPSLSLPPSSPVAASQESEAARLAALEAMKNSLGAPPAGGLSRRVTARGRRSDTGSSARNTVYAQSLGAPSLSEEAEQQQEKPEPVRQQSGVSDDDVPLAVVQQQQQQQQSQHRRAPPPPPSAPAAAAPISPSPSLSPSMSGFSIPALSGPPAGRAASVMSASSSLSPSTAAAAARADPFAGETTPGLRVEVRETVNVLMKQGEAQRVMIAGEVNLSYRPAANATAEGIKVRITGLEQAEKVAPNAAYLSSGGAQGEYTLLPALATLGGRTTPVLKYSLTSPSLSASLPLTLKPVWRTSPGQARAIVSYTLNSSSPLLTALAGPFGEEEPGRLEDVRVDLVLAPGVEAKAVQAKPASASLLPGGRGARFELGTLPPGAGEEKLLASLQTDAEKSAAQPQAVSVSWVSRGRTVGAVGVEVEGEVAGEENVTETRRETGAGKYLAA